MAAHTRGDDQLHARDYTGVKMVMEPPKGLKANLKNAYAKITNDTLQSTSNPIVFQKLLFGLRFFHAIVQVPSLCTGRPRCGDLKLSLRACCRSGGSSAHSASIFATSSTTRTLTFRKDSSRCSWMRTNK
jgi:hypothetical protein